MIEVQGLGHRFPGGKWGLQGLDLEIREGEWILLTGANGCGKTLLMRHLAALVRPTEGRILFQGKDVQTQESRVRTQVGLVFQDSSSQILGLTVEEEVGFGPRNLGLPRGEVQDRVGRCLEAVGLSGREGDLCFPLSGGEKRRLALAGVLAMESPVIILDEPFTGLDYPGVLSVMRILRDLHAQGKTIILITHEIEKCLAQATRVVLMAQGRVFAQGSAPEVWEDFAQAGVFRPRIPRDRWRDLTWLD